MSLDHDPRVYFAAERTLLAWLRTGMAVIGLGFVVARFGLFLRLAAGESLSRAWHWESTAIGVALVILGALAVASAAWKHIRFCRTLEQHERPPAFWLGTTVWFCFAIAILGVILAVYVVLTPAIGPLYGNPMHGREEGMMQSDAREPGSLAYASGYEVAGPSLTRRVIMSRVPRLCFGL